MRCDVLIAGGGLGGCAAALALAEAGWSVVMTEPTDWIGGQATQQGVPPDEHPYIERGGANASYLHYRQGVRDYYKRWFPLTQAAANDAQLSPGGAWVSNISHLPTVSVAVLEAMLAPHRASGRLRVLLHHEPRHVETANDRVHGVTVADVRSGERRAFEPRFVIDASEMGDVLPLAGCEYVTGAEGQAAHGEPHAPTDPDPRNMQAVTWCFAMDMAEGNHVIDRPDDYDQWRDDVPPLDPPWPGRMLSWVYSNPKTLAPTRGVLEAGTPDPDEGGGVSLWTYRQILDPSIFDAHVNPALAHVAEAHHPGITLVNWPQNDYLGGCVFDAPDAATHWAQAKRLSLSLFYWMQTEAPRPDGGTGYPGLRLRGDVLGTEDGFAKHPYIREARRIQARTTVSEHHLGVEARRPHNEAAHFEDAVGIGSYALDLHPTTAGDNYIDIESHRFQIPLGALVPVRLTNLLPAAKNLGVTHIANGAYRLHPVEWAIGEAAGALAAQCMEQDEPPQAVADDPGRTRTLQQRLAQRGVPLTWRGL